MARTSAPEKTGDEHSVHLHLVSGENESETDSGIYIIAIHGLDTKSPEKWTWIDPKDHSHKVNWLGNQDMLPSVVKQAPIFTCDWPAKLYERRRMTQKTITESARLLLDGIQRLVKENGRILFIASCLGGIILMKALQIATGDYRYIKKATRGVIFLATPFRGTSLKNWAIPFLRFWASIQSKQVSMLLDLTTATPDLTEMLGEFTTLCREQGYEISTFYEKGATSLFRKTLHIPRFLYTPSTPLVNEHSARLDIDPHPLALDRNHTMMNKFSSPSDVDYNRVAGKVEWLLNKIIKGTPLQRADTWILDRHYTGRTQERLKIRRLSGEYLPMKQCYINLAIVDFKRDSHNRPEIQSTPFSLFSRLEAEIPDEKSLIELPNLFAPRKLPKGGTKEPRRILIRGRAGVGKTTLCKKIVHDFIYDGMWKRLFKRILWVPLRKLRYKRPENFEQLFYNEYFISGGEGSRELSRELYNAVQIGNEKTLFLLDGFDEVQDLGSEDYPFFSELLNQPNVIITSRPHAFFPANVDLPDMELETIGFYPDQVRHYLEKVAKDVHIVQGIQSFLGKHQVIQGLVRIPIQLDALCLAWNGIKSQYIPKTMTTIYTAIAFSLWKDYIVRNKGKDTNYIRTAGNWEVEDEIGPENKVLEYFAFNGLSSNMLEFLPKHQEAILSNSSFSDFLGRLPFLRSSDPLPEPSNRSYHFLHLTFQEFFAAKYFARQWESGKDLVYLDLNSECPETSSISPKRFLGQNKYILRYDIVWRFTAGLLKPENVPKFLKELEEEQPDLLGPTHQRLIMHCLSETDISHDPRLLSRLEDGLYRWLIFECGLGGFPLLAYESEFPDRAFYHTTRGNASSLLSSQSNLPEQVISNLIELIAAVESLSNRSDLLKETITNIITMLRQYSVTSDFRLNALELFEGRSHLSKQTIDAVMQLLGDEHWNIRSRAADVLKKQSNLSQETLHALRTLLEKADEGLYSIVAEVLGAFSRLPAQVVATLIRLLKDTTGNTRNLPEEVVMTLIPLLQNRDDGIESAACDILLCNQPRLSEQAIGYLQQLNKDATENIENIIAEAPRLVGPIPLRAQELDLHKWWRDLEAHKRDMDHHWSICGYTIWILECHIQRITLQISEETMMVFLTALFLKTCGPADYYKIGRMFRLQSNVPELVLKTAWAQLAYPPNNSAVRDVIINDLSSRNVLALSDDMIKPVVRVFKGLDIPSRTDVLNILATKSNLSREIAKDFVELFEGADQSFQHDIVAQISERIDLLDKILEALESPTAPRTDLSAVE
ncbi:armadillo-type protein [Rostrohypoxylon terebratum]|nr:armadillo-type protein [Rostrohypoxylon terebratum]